MAFCYYLSQLSEVFIPDASEPNYFSYVDTNIDYISNDERFYKKIITNINEYKDIYKSGQNKSIRIDASGSYLTSSEKTISEIKKTISNYNEIKIIIMLRNPIERAFSAYTHYFMNGFDTQPPEKALSREMIRERLDNKWSPGYDYLSGSMYSIDVSRYLEEFKNVKIVLTEDLWRNSKAVFNDICYFLELSVPSEIDLYTKINTSGATKNRYFYDILHNEKNIIRQAARQILKKIVPENDRKKLKNYLRNKNLNRPAMSNNVYNQLKKVFIADIHNLEKVINTDLSGWFYRESS